MNYKYLHRFQYININVNINTVPSNRKIAIVVAEVKKKLLQGHKEERDETEEEVQGP